MKDRTQLVIPSITWLWGLHELQGNGADPKAPPNRLPFVANMAQVSPTGHSNVQPFSLQMCSVNLGFCWRREQLHAELRSTCTQSLEAPSNNKPRILMATWKMVLSRLIWPQSPSCNITTASECLYLVLRMIANIKLVRNTDTDINDAVTSMILRRLCHLLHVRALKCSGFI